MAQAGQKPNTPVTSVTTPAPLSSSPSGEACSATTPQMSIKPRRSAWPRAPTRERSSYTTWFCAPVRDTPLWRIHLDKRAQTRRRGRGPKNNLRGWQLQQAGVGIGRGPWAAEERRHRVAGVWTYDPTKLPPAPKEVIE